MSQPSFRIPEPSTPEIELVKGTDELPKLSPNLRARVLKDCRFQVRYIRRLDQLRAAAIATLLLATVLLLARQVLRWLDTSHTPPASAPVAAPTLPIAPTIPTRELVTPGQSLSQPTQP
jgi:hypothetical protein